MTKGAFTPDLTPVARPGQKVELIPRDEVRRVEAVMPQPGITTQNFTPADGNSEQNEITAIEMDNHWLGQFRLLRAGTEIPDGVNIEVDHDGRQLPLYTTKNQRGQITEDTGMVIGDDGTGTETVERAYTHLTELYVWEAEPPFFTVNNNSGGPIDVTFTLSGFHLRLSREEVSVGPNEHPVAVPVKRPDDA